MVGVGGRKGSGVENIRKCEIERENVNKRMKKNTLVHKNQSDRT